MVIVKVISVWVISGFHIPTVFRLDVRPIVKHSMWRWDSFRGRRNSSTMQSTISILNITYTCVIIHANTTNKWTVFGVVLRSIYPYACVYWCTSMYVLVDSVTRSIGRRFSAHRRTHKQTRDVYSSLSRSAHKIANLLFGKWHSTTRVLGGFIAYVNRVPFPMRNSCVVRYSLCCWCAQILNQLFHIPVPARETSRYFSDIEHKFQ